MDQQSFDRLARVLGGATDRREGLKRALAAVLGGSAAVAALEERTEARRKDRGRDAGPEAGRKKRRKTCKPACTGGYVCEKVGKRRECVCPSGVTCGAACCAAGQRCEGGTCVDAPEPTPTPTCLAFGEACKNVGRRCCDGLTCASGQSGSFPVACYRSKGAACASTDECPFGMSCAGGICLGNQADEDNENDDDGDNGGGGSTCAAAGGDCSTATCCAGLICETATKVCKACSVVSTGNPAADGATLKEILESAKDGDIITVGPGDYIVPDRVRMYSGSTTDPITIQACDPDAKRPVFDGGAKVSKTVGGDIDETDNGAALTWEDGTSILAFSYVGETGACGASNSGRTCAGFKIQDIDFRNANGGWGGAIESFVPIAVTNSTILRCRGRAGGIRTLWLTNLDNVVVTQCYGTFNDAHAGGVYLGGSAILKDVTVTHNGAATGTAERPSAGGVTAALNGQETVTIKGATTIRDNTPNGFFAYRTNADTGNDATVFCESPARICGNPSNDTATGVLNCNGQNSVAGNIVFDASCTSSICRGGVNGTGSAGSGTCADG